MSESGVTRVQPSERCAFYTYPTETGEYLRWRRFSCCQRRCCCKQNSTKNDENLHIIYSSLCRLYYYYDIISITSFAVENCKGVQSVVCTRSHPRPRPLPSPNHAPLVLQALLVTAAVPMRYGMWGSAGQEASRPVGCSTQAFLVWLGGGGLFCCGFLRLYRHHKILVRHSARMWPITVQVRPC